MTRSHQARRAALALLLFPACELPEKLCIGDCPAPIGSSSEGDGYSSDGDATTTTAAADTGDPDDVCAIVDDLAAGPGCNDGVQEPGELCFGFMELWSEFPVDLDSFVVGQFDPGGADLLRSFANGTVSTWSDGPGPFFDTTGIDWPVTYTEDTLILTGVGDLDEDGHPDAVGRRIGGAEDLVEIVRLASGAQFVDATSVSLGPIVFGPEVVDWNQDGHLDLIVVTTMAANLENAILLAGDGTGAFTVDPQFGFAPSETLLAVGALGSDGAPDDFAAVGEDGRIATVPPAGPDVELGASAVVHDIAIAELDGDGRGDIVALYEDTVTGGTTLAIALHDSVAVDGPFTVTRYPVHCGSRTLALGDLDQDGALDVVAGADDGMVTVRLGDGQGGFSRVMSLPLLFARRIEIADFNGDGSNDLGISGPNSFAFSTNFP